MKMRSAVLACGMAAAVAAGLRGQARSAPDWTTPGGDAQRSSWVVADPFISIDSLPKFQFLWKLHVENDARQSNALTAPVALGNLMTFRGFKSLVFVGGSSNNVYAIDYDFGTLFWNTHLNYSAGTPEFAGSARCPGGMTAPLTRATNLVPATGLAFFGFARPPRPARGEVGEPGRGSPRLNPVPAAPVGAAARGTEAGRSAAAAAPARGGNQPARGPNFVFAVPADGIVRALNPHTGDPASAPAMFLPPNANATGLIWANGMVYAATTDGCGTAPEALWAMDWESDAKPVTSFQANGARIGGFALATDGTVYVTTAAGSSTYANAIVALDPKTLAVRQWFSQPGAPFDTAPVVFSEGSRTYVAAVARDGALYVVDGVALGGANHRNAFAVAPGGAQNAVNRRDAPATWRDDKGTRWILVPGADGITAFRFDAAAASRALQQTWKSRALTGARTPLVVNGVVFGLSAGERGGANAVLYALDPSSGKELWTSGSTMTSFATSGLAAGTAQVYVVTFDNTVWSFGIPIPY
jgi:outer membrane protein assembly factor BamB